MKNTITIIYPADFTYMYNINSDNCHDDILFDIFNEWNDGSGCECEVFKNFRVRSMSVGDVVGINNHWYQCMPIGWKKISVAEVLQLETDVQNHPLYKQGPWFALKQVLEENNLLVEI